MILDEKNILKNIIEFKNEILKKINSLELRLTDKINLHDNDFTIKLGTISEKINPIEIDVNCLMNISREKEKKLEKIEYLEKFKNKAETSLLSQNIRINKLFEEISNIKSKYDKIFIENLTIPGFVGHSCKYNNLSEFIIHNMKENNKNDNQYDKIKNEIVSLKQKTDNLQKMYFGIFDNIYDRTNKLTENKIEDIKVIYGKKFEEIWDVISEIKLKIVESRMNFEKHLKDFKLFTEDVCGFKEHLDKLEIKIEQELIKNENEMKENNKEKKNDIDDNKEKITDIQRNIMKYKRENEEIKKINKIIEQKEIENETILFNHSNDIKEIKGELIRMKNLIKLGQNENKMNIFKELNKFNDELNQLKQNIKEINSIIKNSNNQINYQMINPPGKISNEKRYNLDQENKFMNNKNEKGKELINMNNKTMNDIKTESMSNTKTIKKEQELQNCTVNFGINKDKFNNKSRNNNIFLSPSKGKVDAKDLFFTKIQNNKKNILGKNNNKKKNIDINKYIRKNEKEEDKTINKKEEIKIEQKIGYTFIPNIKEEKFTQFNSFHSSRNKFDNIPSNTFNLSTNDLNTNKSRNKREFLSPVVDKMYKEFYIKKNMKEKNKETDNKLKKQIVKKLIPAFGRTNYEPLRNIN